MSNAVEYWAAEYGNGGATEAVALVTGFAGSPQQLDQAARSLVNKGRDVVLYGYDKGVLLDGDAEQLPGLVDVLTADFQKRASGHKHHRYGGVSLGGGIAATMQRRCANPERGLYAATGADAAKLIMKSNLFRTLIKLTQGVDVRRKFQANGYTLGDLQERWRDIDTPPATAFSIALGGMDYVIQYRREMKSRIETWRADNQGISARHLPLLGHTGTIKWFDANCTNLLVAV